MTTIPSKQSGAVLAIALILLLVITLVGVSTLQTTGLEEQMAANVQFKNLAFQSSETAIEEALDDTQFLSDAYTASIDGSAWPTKTATTNSLVVTAVAEAEFVEQTKNVVESDSSTSVSIGGAAWSYYNYQVRGTSNITNAGTSNTNVQGAYIKAPTSDTTI